jgi:hypothetical protein
MSKFLAVLFGLFLLLTTAVFAAGDPQRTTDFSAVSAPQYELVYNVWSLDLDASVIAPVFDLPVFFRSIHAVMDFQGENYPGVTLQPPSLKLVGKAECIEALRRSAVVVGGQMKSPQALTERLRAFGKPKLVISGAELFRDDTSVIVKKGGALRNPEGGSPVPAAFTLAVSPQVVARGHGSLRFMYKIDFRPAHDATMSVGGSPFFHLGLGRTVVSVVYGTCIPGFMRNDGTSSNVVVVTITLRRVAHEIHNA